MAQKDFSDILYETSSKYIVDNINDFLKSFNINYFNDKKLILDIEQKLLHSKRIGTESAFGAAYDIGNYIIKISKICPQEDFTSNFAARLCDLAREGNYVFRIPHLSKNKELLLAPNYIVESLISVILSKFLSKYTPSFPLTYGFQYDINNKEKPVYMMIEKLEPVVDKLVNEYHVFNLIFQLTHALTVSQQLGRFTHYDLHKENILSRPKNQNTVNIYEIGNGKYMYTLFNYDNVMIDFGTSRFETEQMIIIGREPFIPFTQELKDYYSFNPYYDLFSLLFMFYYVMNPSGKTKQIIEELFRSFLNLNSNQELDMIVNDILLDKSLLKSIPEKWYGPEPEKLALIDESRNKYPASTPEEFLSKLCFYFESTGQQNLDKNNLNDVSNFLLDKGIVVLDRKVDLTKYLGNEGSNFYGLIPHNKKMDTKYLNLQIATDKEERIINDFIEISSYNNLIVRDYIEDFNYIVHDGAKKRKDLSKQYYHIARINQKGIKYGYKFDIDCCRIDIGNYFRNIDKSGIAINASQYLSNFLPTGYFKTNNIIYSSYIEYARFYGVVGITFKGNIKLSNNIDDINIFNKAITCGPILVWNHQRIFDEELIRNTLDNNGNKLFQCRLPNNTDEQNVKYFGDGLTNCNMVEPNELYLSSTPLSRTAIGLDNNDNVIFIYVEGEDKRGDGMDLAQLSELCINLKFKHAISLDKFESAQMLWRKPGENIIKYPNPEHTFTHPVGNILSFVEK